MVDGLHFSQDEEDNAQHVEDAAQHEEEELLVGELLQHQAPDDEDARAHHQEQHQLDHRRDGGVQVRAGGEDAAQHGEDPLRRDEDPGGRVVVQRDKAKGRQRAGDHHVDAHVVQDLQDAGRGGQHEEGVEEAAGQEQEHQREGVQHAGPEVVVRLVHVDGLRDEQVAAHHSPQEGDAVAHRVQDLFEHVVAVLHHVQVARHAHAQQRVDGAKAQCIPR
mmetsp:Transcript_5077/g.7004  ORF Transcript_5077/g.7004 Transcript_5077/m.7004 type:complete len:219 (-) Transcript_5077:410-1066(-)